jgi:hypothetical protein
MRLGGAQPVRRAVGVAWGLVAACPIAAQLQPLVAPQLMHL